MCFLWAWMLQYVAAGAAPAAVSEIPNPAKVPASMLGPADVLVYADPWFAGAIMWWLSLGGAGMVILLSVAILAPAGERPARSVAVWMVWSFLLGAIFAVPWVYGLFRLLRLE